MYYRPMTMWTRETKTAAQGRMDSYGRILYALCAIVILHTAMAEPINRLDLDLSGSKDPSLDKDRLVTTVAPPSGLGLLLPPPTVRSGEGLQSGASGGSSQEVKSSGLSSSESQTGTSGAGSREVGQSESSGLASKEQVSGGGGSREQLIGLSGAGSKEQSGVGSREIPVIGTSRDSGLKESGAGSRESGAGSRESGAGSQESGAGSRERDRDGSVTPAPESLPVIPQTTSGVQDLTAGVGGILSREVSSGDTDGARYSQEDLDSLTASPEVPSSSSESHGARNSREAQRVTSSEEAEGGRPLNMEALVRTLQMQLLESQTSQARTRSVLNTITERQTAQDRDLSRLKAELSLLRSRQEKDHTALEEVTGRVSDTAWAVKDLKASTDQLHADFLAFKKHYHRYNDSVLDLEENMGEAEQRRYAYTNLIKRLHHDVQHLKTSFAADHDAMGRLKRLLNNLDWASHQMTTRHDHVNNIPLGGSGDPSSGGSEAGTSNNNYRNDNIASNFEESDNTIGHNIVELYKHKHHMHMQIENVNKRFLQYDAEMSRVYAMYYNLSLQIASLENKLLSRQQHSFDSDMAALQRSFFNFTQQVLNAETMHMTTKAQRNMTSQNEQRMHRLSASVDNHHMRIRTIENLLVDYRSTNQDFRRMLDAHLMSMNESVVSVRGRLKDHKSKATLTFSDVTQQVTDLRNEVKQHNARLLEVEVHTLNETLSKCRKANEDMVQDMKIDQVRSDIYRLDAQVADHTGQITRHDRSLSTIYKEVQGNNKLIGEVMTQNKALFDVLPRTTTLEEEIDKLLMHLPKDCAVPLAENNNRDGLYLIKPPHSIKSVQVYCDVDKAGPWLVIQRRESGRESFARTWDEYRDGFGSPDKDFWIGNENINKLTGQEQYRLHIDMWDLDDVYYYVEYDYFRVENADTNYRLLIDGYSGNATDALRYSNYMPFSTMDRDHDVSSTHCAKFYTSGWWYKHCHYSNLNGRYTVGVVWFNHDFDEWIQMKRTVMKIQAVDNTYLGSGS